MITLKETNELLNQKINKVLKEIETTEEKAKQIMYSQHRTAESIYKSATDVLLAKKRLESLKKLKTAVCLIKKSDENTSSTQNILVHIKNTLLKL